MITLNGKYSNAKIMIDQVEPECISQIVSMINNPVFVNPVAIMPDCHAGKGSVIGFTMKRGDKIIPNIIGVDIGCGMLSMNIGKVEINFSELDSSIRKRIPFGMNTHEKAIINMRKNFPFGEYSYEWFEKTCKRIGMDVSYAINSIGTLGGGNHFIEIGKSISNNDIWITVHSGSRNFGKKVCDYWQKVAEGSDDQTKKLKMLIGLEEIKKTSKSGTEIGKRISELKQSLNIVKKVSGLEFLEGSDVDGYLEDMYFAQQYAEENRYMIMSQILIALKKFNAYSSIQTVHNFIDPQDQIIRKGSIRSYVNEIMLIPFNPFDGLLICEGKSNPEWNFSAPHGAGRVMSRGKAKKTITKEMADEAMKGVYASSRPLDESPLVYKNSALIEKFIEPTAKIIDRIKPIMNLKANDGDE